MASSLSNLRSRLDRYYQQIDTIILSRQHPVSGLLPASTAVNVHGDYTDAWVRDNVYSILAVWGLALAYRKIDTEQSRTFLLEQSVVKLMRGLLRSMLRQVHKVETFKYTQAPLDALHAKYDTPTGEVVVGDAEWGHLQLDATSLYLLMLAQMTASGLQIIYTLDEANFIQNLVYYIGRAYQTPDYGIWERGNKLNHGNPELNASSVGMAKAALEAMNELNLFGMRGDQASVIHIMPDEIARAQITLEALLPRESGSKEVDGALLSVISFPAFAVQDPDLIDRTRDNVIEKLQGHYGCKRFLRDGHQTVSEDTNRLHYEPGELMMFEAIECEWPLFFTYLLLDGLFQQDAEQVEFYQQRLAAIAIERQGIGLLPELYLVPEDAIEAEKAEPGSQKRVPNENIPLVWAQSLYLLGHLLIDGCIALGDLDPLGRHLAIGQIPAPAVQVALLAEDEELQAELATYGIATQTLQQVAPIQVRPASELTEALQHVGQNSKLGLTGRPPRRVGSLLTSQIFRIQQETIVFLPALFDNQQFYLTLDYHFLISLLQSELVYVQRHWCYLGRPTVTLLLTQPLVQLGQAALLDLMQAFRAGESEGGVQIKLGPLQQLLLRASQERIDDLREFRFQRQPLQGQQTHTHYLQFNLERSQPLTASQELRLERLDDAATLIQTLYGSVNLFEQIEILQTLLRLQGRDFVVAQASTVHSPSVADLLYEIYFKAGSAQLWSVVRRVAGLLDQVYVGLADAVTNILAHQKQIAVGRAYSDAALLSRPIPVAQVMAKIRENCREDIRDRVLTQEILIYLDLLIKSEPEAVKGLLTLRVGYLIVLLTSEIARESGLTQDEAYDDLMELSPYDISMRLRQVLSGYDQLNVSLQEQESLRVEAGLTNIDWSALTEAIATLDTELEYGDLDYAPVAAATIDASPSHSDSESWRSKRAFEGALNRIPQGFYANIWQLLNHTKGIVIGDKFERRNRLDSALLLTEMTAGEKNFALLVEHLLNKIDAPAYRQLNVEALITLASIIKQQPELKIDDYLVLDVIIGHAVRLAWQERFPERIAQYEQEKAAAWAAFYEQPPVICSTQIATAFRFLLTVTPVPTTKH
ncbi:MAG: glycoside hydrolase family 15 protein [Cyanobacteria bacterium P01_H01_bin.121]